MGTTTITGRRGIAVLATLAMMAAGGFAHAQSATEDTFTLQVTTLGLCNEPIAWGIEQGIFAQHGLELELLRVTSGAAGIAALQSGDVDVAYVNSLSALQAVESGVAIKIVSGATLSTPDSNAVLVGKDSDIDEPKDLAGKKLAINQLGGLGHILTQSWINESAGKNTRTMFVTLPFPDQVPAVVAGSVDAAQVMATQVVSGAADGTVRSIGNPFYDGVGHIPTVVYIASDAFIEKHPDELARFATAMTELAEAANNPDNNESRYQVTADFCRSSQEIIQKTPEPLYEGQVDMDKLKSLMQVLNAHGQATKVDIETVVADFGRRE